MSEKRLKTYRVTIVFIIKAEDDNDALWEAHEYLELGVIPRSVDIQEVSHES
jgi:hypothetical protein